MTTVKIYTKHPQRNSEYDRRQRHVEFADRYDADGMPAELHFE